MNQLLELSNAWSAFLMDRVGSFLLQSIVLVAGVAITTSFLRQASPAIRCWLWRIVAIKLLLLPFWTVDMSLPTWFAVDRTTPEVDISANTSPALSPHVVTTPVFDVTSGEMPRPIATQESTFALTPIVKMTWQTWLLFVWLGIACFQVFRVITQRNTLRKLLQHSEPGDSLKSLVRECAAQLRSNTLPEIRLVDEELSPFVCGLRHPLLVLPKSLASSAEPKLLRHIVLHELTHIQRRDLLWCWISSVVQIVYWFHPAVHWVVHRIQLERELACDQVAIQHSDSSPGDYAQTLIDVVSHTASRVAAQAAFSTQFLGGSKR